MHHERHEKSEVGLFIVRTDRDLRGEIESI